MGFDLRGNPPTSSTHAASKGYVDGLLVNAKANGVKGDGTTDDSAAINALITTVAAVGGGTILFPAGVYSVASSIILRQGVYLTSTAANHGYTSGVRTVNIVATAAIAAGSYVIDTIAGGIASAGGTGIDVSGNGTCGGVRFSRISWGAWTRSNITNCGGSALWEGGGVACVFEDLLITTSLLTVPTAAVGGAFDIGNTVNSTQGTDHYIARCEFAARGNNDALTSTNMYAAAAAIRGSNHFISDSVGETSDLGWYVTATRTSFSHVRADTNKGHGFWLVGGTNTLTGTRSIGNSQAGTGLYDGYYIEAGAWGTKLLAPAVFIAGSIKPRYGINSAVSGGDPVYALQIVNPTVEDSGTARYNLTGYYGVVFPAVALAPTATATPDVHETVGPFDLSGWAVTTVTNFIGGVDGQSITVIGAPNVTIANNGSIVTSTGVAKALTVNAYRFTRKGGVWYEDARPVTTSSSTVTATVQTANYVLALADAGTVVEMNATAANTVTVPPNSTVAFPIGTVIEVYQAGTGQTAIAAGAGVTVRTSASLTARTIYSTLALRKRATDEWVLSGDLT